MVKKTTHTSWAILLALLLPFGAKAQVNGDTLSKDAVISCYDTAFVLVRSKPLLAIAHFEEMIPFFKHYELMNGYTGSHNALSQIHMVLGNYEEGEAYARRGIEVTQKSLDKDHLQYTDPYYNLAFFLREKGKFKETLAIYRELLDIHQNKKERNPEAIFLSLYEIATTYDRGGDYLKAIEFYEKAEALLMNEASISDRSAQNLFLALGWIQNREENWQSSLSAFRKCLSFASPLGIARSYYGIANSYLGMGKYDSCVFFIQKGNSIETGAGNAYKQVGEELLGEMYFKTADPEKALFHLKEAQKIRLQQKNAKSLMIDIARGYKRIGEIQAAQNLWEESLGSFQQSVSVLSRNLPDSSDWKILPDKTAIKIPRDMIKLMELKAFSLFTLYQSSQEQSLLELAHRHIERGIDLIPEIEAIQESEESKLKLSEGSRSLVELGIEISTELYKLSQDQSYLWDAFSFAEAIKSRLLIEEILESRAITFEALPDSVQQQLDGLQADIEYYKNRLTNTEQQSAQDSIQAGKWTTLIAELEAKQKELTDEVVRKYPGYRKKNLNDNRLDAAFIKESLPERSLLIEYFWGENMAYRFQMNVTDISIESIPLSDEILLALDQTAAHTRKPDMSQEGLLGFCKNAHELFQALKLPLPDSAIYDSWYIVPDGPLAFVPFEVLLSSYPEQTLNSRIPAQAYRKLPYLLKSQHIQYLHAASLIEKEADRQGPILQDLAAFAPNYEGLLQLKHNKASAQEIGKLLGGKTYLDQDASEKTFKSEANNFKAVHLAVHGNANVEDPIKAYLDFGKEQEDDDGKLYVHELYSLSLDSRIVSLIACEAGYGKLQKGEGVMSLARAFRMAGAKSIMTSLWKADGRAAAPISESFYRFLKEGQKPSRALKTAKLEFLASASPDMTHPYFWSTYVLTGQDISVWNPFFKTYGMWLLLLLAAMLLYWVFSLRNKKIKLS